MSDDTMPPAPPAPHPRRLGNPKLAIGYLRVSTDKQELGPEAQRAAIEVWAQRESIGVIAWYKDETCGETDLEDRPGLVAAVTALRIHQAGILAVAKRDRLARDAAVAAFIDRSVQKAGGRVVSADGIGNDPSPAGQFMRSILDATAAYERALIRQRTKDALRIKRARGERAGAIPFGYRVAAEGRRNAAGRVQDLEEDPAEQAVLRRIAELVAGGKGPRPIARQLAQEGAAGRAGRPLGVTQVARLVAVVREKGVDRADQDHGRDPDVASSGKLR
jgi:DNA invertase Pin-like site-specific DNA recombinase